MSSRSEKDRQKAVQDKCQQLLNEMLRDEDNKYCVDCDAKGPRWASWNLGIFLCIRCAGIHRNLGVHISKVKSVNLDTWTPEQVVSLQQMGNSRARAVYEANLPDNFRRPQTDSPLESFVRAKYEQKKYIAREWVPPTIPKVNWDKEIEEEELARRRRKESKSASAQSSKVTASPGGHSMSSEIPAPLPKPKASASPKPSRTFASSSMPASNATISAPTSTTLDLLGLDTPTSNSTSPGKGDDIFSGFLSAPPPPNSSNVCQPNISDSSTDSSSSGVTGDSKRSVEENNFFNQPASAVQEKKQLTKDSILALYSTVPSSAVSQPQNQAFGGVSGSVFPNQGITGFGGVSNTGMGLNFPVSNGMMLGQSAQQAPINPQPSVFGSIGNQSGSVNAAPANSVPMPNLVSNPFFNMTGQGPSTGVFPLQNQMPQLPQQMNMLNISGTSLNSTAQQGVNVPNVGINPWATPSQPTMGTGIMNVSQGSFPQGQTSLGHTLASNLWQ